MVTQFSLQMYRSKKLDEAGQGKETTTPNLVCPKAIKEGSRVRVTLILGKFDFDNSFISYIFT